MKKFRIISASQFAFILLLFFLPFVNVSCSNVHIMTLTGQQLATGAQVLVPTPLGGQELENVKRNTSATLALGIAVSGVLLSLFGGLILRLVCALWATSGAVMLFFLKGELNREIASHSAEVKGLVQVDYLLGFWMCLLLFICVAATNIYAFVRGTTDDTRPPPTTHLS